MNADTKLCMALVSLCILLLMSMLMASNFFVYCSFMRERERVRERESTDCVSLACLLLMQLPPVRAKGNASLMEGIIAPFFTKKPVNSEKQLTVTRAL